MNTDEFAVQVNNYVTDYIKYADAKAVACITLVSMATGVLVATSGSIIAGAKGIGGILYVLALLALCSLMVSTICTLWFALNALRPRVKSPNKSLHSFPDIAEVKLDNLKSEMDKLSPTEIRNEVIKHNLSLSLIAKEKFESIDRSMLWFRVSMLSGGMSVMIYAGINIFGAVQNA